MSIGAILQGLMAVLTQSRPATVTEGNVPVLYVDFLETAPWNLKGLHVRPRFLGVGTVLIAEAVLLSRESGWRGRVGLHSLPQAERFYDVHCQMTRTGPDPQYHDLVYFEYTEDMAAQLLERLE
jgi:hypothetical protein